MAGISVDGGHGGKKAVDSEIPLVPFIDLLLCCVMFLLVTAVWNQLARIDANQKQPGAEGADQPPPEEKLKVVLQVKDSGYILSTTAGDRVEMPKLDDNYDTQALRDRLQERKRLDPNRSDLIVAPQDGVMYADVVEVMDIVVGEGFPDMSLSDSAAFDQ